MPVAPNPVFPVLSTSIALPIQRTALWSTLTQESIAGVDNPVQPWTYGRYRYTIPYSVLRAAAAFGQLQTLLGFYNGVGGRAGVFQYDDPQDDTAPTDQPFGTGDGTTTAFQLVRTYGAFVEPVFAVNAVTNVKDNGSVVGGGSYAVSSRGVVTFNVAPTAGHALTWNGTFLWFCRFDDDKVDFEQFTAAAVSPGPLWRAKLSFTTVKFGS